MRSLYRLLLMTGIAVTVGCSQKPSKNLIVIETQFGDIEAQLYPGKAPKTVAAILSYIDAGFYQRSSFYRILSEENQPMGSAPAELIQGGLWANKNRRDDLKGIPHEPTSVTGLKHINGALSLARQDTGTGSTEFFICIGDQPGFDFGGENNADKQGYAVFGQVVKGMDIVMKIYRRPEENQLFIPPVDIINIRRK